MTNRKSNDPVVKEFASRLRAKLKEKNMNQSDLAREASRHLPPDKPLARDLVSNYVRGINLPRPATLAAICKALDCGVADLIPSRAEPAPALNDSPFVEAKSIDDRTIWIRVNAVLPWQVAIQVMDLVNSERSVGKAVQ